jgi:hypothetical protein
MKALHGVRGEVFPFLSYFYAERFSLTPTLFIVSHPEKYARVFSKEMADVLSRHMRAVRHAEGFHVFLTQGFFLAHYVHRSFGIGFLGFGDLLRVNSQLHRQLLRFREDQGGQDDAQGED